MATQKELRFGPYVLGPRMARRRDLTLHRATYFGPDGAPVEVALRRTPPCADGANEAVLERAARYAGLEHANITKVLDFGALDGRTYVATERVIGHNLLRVLGRCGQKKVGFPTDVALYVMQSILRALDHAHRLGQVHGDLTHTNVLMSMDGAVKVCDFGLSLTSTRRRTSLGLHVGVGRGYSCYMSPEQARGEPASPATDVFGAGILLYELITGHVLFGSSGEESLFERVSSGVYPVPLERHRPDLHPDLQAIVIRALSARPQDRFPSAKAFLLQIHALVEKVHVELDALFARKLMGTLFTTRPAARG